TMMPKAPSSALCLHKRTTVRLKFGSASCGMDRRSAGANDEDTCTLSLAFQSPHDGPEIGNEPLGFSMARLVVRCAQQRGRVHRCRDKRRQPAVDEFPAAFCHLEILPEERLSSGRAEAHDRAWLDQLNLGLQPGPARRDFRRVRFLVDSPFSPGFPLEV